MDTCQITTIDKTNVNNGYVLVTCVLTISSNSYTQVFTVSEIDPIAVASSIKSQAEQFKMQVQVAASISVSASATLDSIVGTTIDL